MYYAKIMRLEPTTRRIEEVYQTLEEFHEWLKEQPGFVFGTYLRPVQKNGAVVRLTVWENRRYADAVSTTEHALAVRSSLRRTTRDQKLEEEEFSAPAAAFEEPSRELRAA